MFNFRRARWMGKKKKMFCLRTHLHPPILKKETPDLMEVHFVVTSFFNLIFQHELGFQLQMALGDQIHHAFAICSGS